MTFVDEPEIPVISGAEVTPLPPVPPPVVEPELVELVAPSDLPEGYQLQVEVNGQNRFVIVPPGGVKQGQSFQARPFVPASMTTTPTMSTTMPYGAGDSSKPAVPHFIPMNHWRDGLCDCFKHGCCHAMCCLGCFFRPILVGQVMTRMSRDILGGPGPRPSVSNTCKIVTTIFLSVLVIQTILNIIRDSQACFGGRLEYNFDTKENQIVCPDGSIEEPSQTYNTLRFIAGLVSFAFGLYMLIATCRTRQAIRNKYNINTGCCGSCEDCCCSFWCSCCTVQQMARHTNDYSTYDVSCCSNDCCNKRGQQPHLPEIDV